MKRRTVAVAQLFWLASKAVSASIAAAFSAFLECRAEAVVLMHTLQYARISQQARYEILLLRGVSALVEMRSYSYCGNQEIFWQAPKAIYAGKHVGYTRQEGCL